MNHPTDAAAAPRGRAPSGGELAGLSVYLAAAVVLPLLAGLVGDAVAHTGPVFFLLGLLVGIAAASAIIYTRFKRYL
jgi:F0F1-type ATP synthase assembly protein I